MISTYKCKYCGASGSYDKNCGACVALLVKERNIRWHGKDRSRAISTLPTGSTERKAIPVYSGFIRYFPDAMAAVAAHSYNSNAQHNGEGSPLHWDRSKSTDELDALMRHILEEDWVAAAWRIMAHLQKELEYAEPDKS